MSLRIPPSLRHRRFRLLWLGLMISVAGSQMQLAALLWHIRLLTDKPIALGGIGAARILPVIFFSLVSGAVADTANRRTVMFVTQSAMTLVALALSFLTIFGHIQLWHIYLLTAIQAVAISFDLPARQSLMPNLVPPRDLANAFSLQSMAFQLGAIIGPGLSGLVIASLGMYAAYLINAVSFLAVLVALIAIGPVAQAARPGQRLEVNTTAIREGIQFITSHPIILSTMLIDFIATFFASATTLLPFYARDVLHVSVLEYGWLAGAQSIGALAATLVLSQLTEIRRQGPLFMISVMIFGLATVAFGLSHTFWLAMLTLAVVGAADSVSTVIRNTIRQLQTPDYIRGRMTSINQIFFQGGPQLGEIESGIAATLLGPSGAIIFGGAGCLVAVAAIVRRWPQLTRYQGEPAAQPA